MKRDFLVLYPNMEESRDHLPAPQSPEEESETREDTGILRVHSCHG